jgi:hypothetical protein
MLQQRVHAALPSQHYAGVDPLALNKAYRQSCTAGFEVSTHMQLSADLGTVEQLLHCTPGQQERAGAS